MATSRPWSPIPRTSSTAARPAASSTPPPPPRPCSRIARASPRAKAGCRTSIPRRVSRMNAPFQARAGLRDPFTAFVCDDATADMLRPVAVEHGWSPEKVNKGGLRNAVQSLSVSASPNILFVDLSESADPLNDINALAEVCEPGTIVIAAGTVNDVRLYRDLVASGIHDYLLKPFTVDQLRDTFAHAQMILSGPRGEAAVDRPHIMT